MENIKILRMSLENFKCHENLTIDFEGRNTAIYGDNATGKTSIYDALTWLLFGKDSLGNGEKNIEIKPLDAMGAVKDHLSVTAVEAVLSVNGETLTLRRTLKEVWTTKRGSSEATYDGNTSEYYVDGVPCKKNAFSDRVNDIVSEETFRMLTSVTYFARDLSWQERRAELFRVAGVMDDDAIMASDERFAGLAASMGRLSVEDYKKKLLAEKRGFVGAKTEIPARISECMKTIEDVAALDFEAAEAEIARLSAQKDKLDADLFAMENDTATEKKRMELREWNFRMEALENENAAHRRLQMQSVGQDPDSLLREAAKLENQLSSRRYALKGYERSIEETDKQIAACRERWMAVNGEYFSGGVCKACGQTLPVSQTEAAKAAFEASKKERLREIEEAAAARKSSRAQTEERIAELHTEIENLEDNIRELKEKAQAARENAVTVCDLDDYAKRKTELTEQIRATSAELASLSEDRIEIKGKLVRELQGVKRDLDTQREILSRESLLDYTKTRVETLKEDAKKAAESLARIEEMLYLIDEYARYKTHFVEDSINSRFRLAKFRLFREQANGGIEDRCDVTYDGVPYLGVNNGAKINLGIDIINTLSEAYGVRVPLFVDNAESVTSIEPYDGQIIRLAVSEFDKELRVTYEN